MYPATPAARDRFILDRRVPRPVHDAWRYQDLVVEDERTADGSIAPVATVFLTGRECPWRCVMCDLWQYTTATDTPSGAIPAQLAAARAALAERPDRVTRMKLYNAGNFFDPRAVPEADYREIAAALTGLERIVVESHPSLIGARVDRFLEALGGGDASAGRLEVAMGLETAHPAALSRLHKQITVEDFSTAAGLLAARGVALRVFLLISPPFVAPAEQDEWLLRSIDVAFSCGAAVVSLVPTRPGNGAMESLADDGDFRMPRLNDIERSADLAHAQLRQKRSSGDQRLFVDLWDLQRFSDCDRCLERRRARLHAINLTQRVVPACACPSCGGTV